MIGSDGAQVSLAAVIPEQIVALDAAVRRDDWALARSLHEVIYPLSVAIYRRPPGNRATARLKKALQLLGRIPTAAARPPIQELPVEDCAVLEAALKNLSPTGQGPSQRIAVRP